MTLRQPIIGFTAVAAIGIMGLTVCYVPSWMPDGFSAGENETYEGRLDVPARGWQFALLERKSLIVENENSLKRGVQRVETICLLASSSDRLLREAINRAPPDNNGTRRIWIRMIAEPRTATGNCMNWYQRTGRPRQHWGRYLRPAQVQSAEPMKDGLHLLDGQSVV